MTNYFFISNHTGKYISIVWECQVLESDFCQPLSCQGKMV